MENWKEKPELRTRDGKLAWYYVPPQEINLDDGIPHFSLHLIGGLIPVFPFSDKVWNRNRVGPYEAKYIPIDK